MPQFPDKFDVKLLILAFSLFALFVNAQAVKDWEAEFKKVQAYDTFTERLKNSDGTWVRPKPQIVALLKELSPAIEKAATELGVDKRAIAGSVLAENSMNVGISDGVQDWLVKTGLAPKGEIFGKKFTFGLGQLNFTTAREAEDYVAKIENRSRMNDDELEEALKDPEKSIRMIAEVIKKTQDDYKKNGFNIENDPAILSTLYNLGGSEKRAAEAKKNNRLPKTNYFGLFVDKNLSTIEKTIGKPEIKPVNVIVPPANTQPQVVASTVATKKAKIETTHTKKAKEVVSSTPTITKRTVLTKAISLVQSPPTCDDGSYGNQLQQKYNSYKQYGPVGVAEKGNSFTLLSPAIDCEARRWSLIRSEKGVVGWVRSEDLETLTTEEYSPLLPCKENENKVCKEAVEKTADQYLKKDETSKLSYLHPISSEGHKPNFKMQNNNCQDSSSDTYGGSMGGPHGQTNMVNGAPVYTSSPSSQSSQNLSPLPKPKNTTVALERLFDAIQKKGTALSKVSDLNNPYHDLISNFEENKKSLRNCIDMQIAERSNCDINLPETEAKLRQWNIPRKPTIDDVEQVRNGMLSIGGSITNNSSYYISRPWAATGEEVESLKKESSLKLLESCKSKLTQEGLDQSAASYVEFIKTISSVTEKEWQENIKHRFMTANMIKLCAANLDLYFDYKLEPKNKTTVCNAKFGEIIATDYSVMSKKLAKQYTRKETIDRAIVDDQRLFLKFKSTSKPVAKSDKAVEDFCPNKTADYIEELLTKHPCIQHIYVPNRWLMNRLNALGSSVIYRPFVDDDVYAVDYSETNCK